MCGESKAGLFSLKGKPPKCALFPPAAYRSVTTASEEQSAHTSYLPTTQFLHPSPPHPKARPRLRTHSGSLTAAATRSPLETRALRLQMSYNFLQRKPTESQAETTTTGSQRQPEAKIRAPRKQQQQQQQHNLAPSHRGRGGARPRALPAPPSAAVSAVTHGSRSLALSAPGAGDPRPPARPPSRDASRGAWCKPPPLAHPRSGCGCGAGASCPTRGPGPAPRRSEGVPRTT